MRVADIPLMHKAAGPEHIYNPIIAMGFSVMFMVQLDNTKR